MYYYQLQAPGHVNGLMDVDRNLVNHYRYTPFGTPADGFPVEGTPNPLQYMARELDATTGLYYVRNRWYDPEVGRFVSEDPIGLAGGMNLYVCASNNPVSLTDPYGLNPRCTTGRVASHDPLFGSNGSWNFMHGGENWIKIVTGSVVILCPNPFGGMGPTAGAYNPDRPGATNLLAGLPRFCRRTPAHPSEANLEWNVAVAEWAGANVWLPRRLQYFRALVAYGGPWDYKTISMEYEPFGNWHYGVTGRAMGFPRQVLLRAAGWAQQQQDYADPSAGNWWDPTGPFGDETADQMQIRTGMNAYDTGCAP